MDLREEIKKVRTAQLRRVETDDTIIQLMKVLNMIADKLEELEKK